MLLIIPNFILTVQDYQDRMPRKFLLLAVSIIAWVIFGAIIGGVGALILNYTWVINVMFYGAVIGLGIGLLGLVVAFIVRSREVIIWIKLETASYKSATVCYFIATNPHLHRSFASKP